MDMSEFKVSLPTSEGPMDLHGFVPDGPQARRLPCMMNVMMAPIKNTTKSIFAMPAAPAARPPKPSSAAMSAMTRKTTA